MILETLPEVQALSEKEKSLLAQELMDVLHAPCTTPEQDEAILEVLEQGRQLRREVKWKPSPGRTLKQGCKKKPGHHGRGDSSEWWWKWPHHPLRCTSWIHPLVADKFSSAIDAVFEELESFPQSGSIYAKTVRRKLVPGFYQYGIFYTIVQ